MSACCTPHLTVTRARALWIELKVTLLSIIRGKWFADYYLPYIVPWIAVALVLDNHFIA